MSLIEESMVSINYCNAYGMATGSALDWRRLNVTELATPYPNSELSSRFGCNKLSSITRPGFEFMQSPLISLPVDLTSFYPEWGFCDVMVYATDPPRPLTWVPEEAFSADSQPPPPPPPSTTQGAGWATPVPAPTNSQVPDPIPTMTTGSASPPQDPPKDKPRPRPVDISPAKADGDPHTASGVFPAPNPDVGKLEGDATSSDSPTPASEPASTSVKADPGAGDSPAGPVNQNGKDRSSTGSDPEKEDQQASGTSSTSLPEPVPGDQPSPSAASPNEAAATQVFPDADRAGDGAAESIQNDGNGTTPSGEQQAADGPRPKQIQEYTGTVFPSPGDDGNTKSDPSTVPGSEQFEDTGRAPAEGEDTSSIHDSSTPDREQSKDTTPAPAGSEDTSSINDSSTPDREQSKDTTLASAEGKDASSNDNSNASSSDQSDDTTLTPANNDNTDNDPGTPESQQNKNTPGNPTTDDNNNSPNTTSPDQPNDASPPSNAADIYTNAANSSLPFSNATSRPSTSATFVEDLIPTLSSNPDPDTLVPTGSAGVTPDPPGDGVVGQDGENIGVRMGGSGIGLCMVVFAVVVGGI
ncbi:MAG: hypothetical protein Q9174_002254 [Haloplaca sp. 1 TL-2023]